jgi:hypothetical protein
MRVENCQPPTANCQPKRYARFAIIVSLLFSCTQNTDTPSGDLNGVYAGYYAQTGAVKDYAYVKLVFVGSNFSGESTDSLRSVCNGSYQISSDSIHFTNFCSTPDPELLLAGKYKMKTVGDSLYFSRDSPPDTIRYAELFSLKSQ